MFCFHNTHLFPKLCVTEDRRVGVEEAGAVQGGGGGVDTDPHEFHAVVQGSFPSEKQKEVLIIRQDHVCKLDKKHFKKSPQQKRNPHHESKEKKKLG